MVLTMFDRLQQSARTDLMAVGAIFASLAYGENNVAEQAWLERVIQDMYDLVQQTPLYQSWTRRAREEGKEEGLKEGKLEGLRQTLVNIVQVRFPRLTSLARTQAAHIADPDVLDGLIIKVSTAQHVQEVQQYLRGDEEGEQNQHEGRA